jgi:restriction system protein
MAFCWFHPEYAPMPVPTFDKFIEPLLRLLVGRAAAISASEARDLLATELGLTEDDKAERVPSGQQSVYANRVGWAHDRLKRAELSQSVQRGVWQITPKGVSFAAQHAKPLRADVLALLTHPNAEATASKGSVDVHPSVADASASPDDRIDAAVREIRDSVATELLELIGRESPGFFESLVLDLLHAMGCGLSREDLQTVGATGDGGIDGIISLDRLGLQKVYVQAKRWVNPVGGPVVRDFIGALTTRGADKGVLLTTSKFTADAYATAEKVRTGSIALIDGRRLAELMIEHGVGVSHRPLRVPRIDNDYFEG